MSAGARRSARRARGAARGSSARARLDAGAARGDPRSRWPSRGHPCSTPRGRRAHPWRLQRGRALRSSAFLEKLRRRCVPPSTTVGVETTEGPTKAEAVERERASTSLFMVLNASQQTIPILPPRPAVHLAPRRAALRRRCRRGGSTLRRRLEPSRRRAGSRRRPRTTAGPRLQRRSPSGNAIAPRLGTDTAGQTSSSMITPEDNTQSRARARPGEAVGRLGCVVPALTWTSSS